MNKKNKKSKRETVGCSFKEVGVDKSIGLDLEDWKFEGVVRK